MIGTETGPFLLTGYVLLNENGFALPAYSARPGANAWHAAVPEVDGDHQGLISHFEMIQDEDVLLLPQADIEVSAGDTWRDVFLWNGRAYVGTPRQILQSVEAWRDELEAAIPLSFLDLLIAAEAPLAVRLSATALTFLGRRLGDGLAVDAYREVVLRPGILLEIRRQLHRRDPTLPLTGLSRDFVVTEGDPGSLCVELAAGTSAMVGGQPAIDALGAAIGRFGDLLGISIVMALPAADPIFANVEPVVSPVLPEADAAPPFGPLEAVTSLPNILIIASDRRAAQIARYFEPPAGMTFGSAVTLDTGRYSVERTGGPQDPMLSDRDAVIHVSDGFSTSAPLDRYDLVVWLAGNESLENDAALERIRSVARESGAGPFLLAPAAPADGPSVLADPEGLSRRLLEDCNAVIDTTVARSPFWTGQARRSIDRRIADIVVTVGLAVVLDDNLRRAVRKARGAKTPAVLTFAGTGEFTVERSTASELNAAGLIERERDRHSRAHAQFELRDRSDGRFRHVFIELQSLRSDFERFALAVVTEALGAGGRWRDIGKARDEIAPAVLRALDHPTLACAIPPPTADGRSVIITAETPDLTVLREAANHGVAVARYTDTGTIRTLLDGSRGRFDLPVEIRLPKLHRYVQNRGLATRGVDARDVFRMSETSWRELLDAYPTSELLGQERRYLAAIDTHGADPDLALPAPAIWNAFNSGDALAQQIVGRHPKFGDRGALDGKRIGDLIAAWSRPADGARRWVVEDGRIPVEMGVLEFDEVPAQRLFQIDGDDAVPLFLMSRVFAVWAWALLPASTSWASRFQVSKTFDAFPFPLGFSVRPSHNGSPPQLRLSRSEAAWRDLSDELGDGASTLAELSQELGRDEIGLRRHPLMQRIDQMLLSEFDLSQKASDLDILERLVRRNLQQE